MKQKVKLSKTNGRRIIFSDEAVFTTATIPDKSYAMRGENIVIEEKLASSPALAIVAGVSEEMGMEAFYIHPRSIDSDGLI